MVGGRRMPLDIVRMLFTGSSCWHIHETFLCVACSCSGWQGVHRHTKLKQGSELHMVKKEEGKEKQQLTGPEPATSRSVYPLAIDLEVAGSGPVSCCFSIPSSFFTMCSSLACLSLVSPWYVDHLH